MVTEKSYSEPVTMASSPESPLFSSAGCSSGLLSSTGSVVTSASESHTHEESDEEEDSVRSKSRSHSRTPPRGPPMKKVKRSGCVYDDSWKRVYPWRHGCPQQGKHYA